MAQGERQSPYCVYCAGKFAPGEEREFIDQIGEIQRFAHTDCAEKHRREPDKPVMRFP